MKCPGKIRIRQETGIIVTGLLITLYLILWPRRVPSQWELSPLWEEDNKEHKNPHNYPYLANPRDTVCEGDVDLLILVASARKHSDRREAIRDTWGSSQLLQTKVVFILGTSKVGGSELELDRQIKEEVDTYNDLIQEDFVDSYLNLTLKTVAGLKWSAIFCPQTKFLMKTDDDIYVNTEYLLDFLQENHKHSTGLITGCIKNGPAGAAAPLSPSGMVFKSPHPSFTAGAGYLISGDLVERLYLASLSLRLIRVEDAFVTGHCAKKIGLSPRHQDGFSCGQLVNEDCHMDQLFTGHKVSPDRMRTIHNKLGNGLC